MAWDPQTYLQFGDERTRPARDLLARIALAAPRRIADLGCGPGNSTALLAARWPDAVLDGIDSSAEMLSSARNSGVRAQWIEADLAQWAPAQAYDLLFSNATLQWLCDHAVLLPRLLSHVTPQGVFAVQMPDNFDEPCHTLLRHVSRGRSWEKKFAGVRDWFNVLAPAACYEILEPHAARIEMWETIYHQVLTGEDAVYRWMSGTGLRPFADALEGGEREAFLEAYRAGLAKAYPARASGVTLYPFRRLFFVAQAR